MGRRSTRDHDHSGTGQGGDSISPDVSRTASRTETINVPSDQATIADAVAEIEQIRATPGITYRIHIESGHTLSTEAAFENGDYRHVRVTSADATVGIETGSAADTNQAVLVNYAIGPRWEVTLNGNGNARGYTITGGSFVEMPSGAGAENCTRGVSLQDGSVLLADDATNVFRNNTDRGVSATRHSTAYCENADLSGNGDINLRVGGSAFAHVSGADLSGSGRLGIGCNNALIRGDSVDLSGAGDTGISAVGGAILHVNSAVLDNATERAIDAKYGAIVNAPAASITGGTNSSAVRARHGGTVVVENATIGGQVRAVRGSWVTARGASISGAGVLVAAIDGGWVELTSGSVSGNDDASEINPVRGGIIALDSTSTSSSTGGAPHSSNLAITANTVTGDGIIFATTTE